MTALEVIAFQARLAKESQGLFEQLRVAYCKTLFERAWELAFRNSELIDILGDGFGELAVLSDDHPNVLLAIARIKEWAITDKS